jgi:hypothetical protein
MSSGRIERRELITRNISIYEQDSGELAQERRRCPSKLTSGKTLSQRTWKVINLVNTDKERVRQGDLQNTGNQPYECTAVGVLDVNERMTRHVKLIG